MPGLEYKITTTLAALRGARALAESRPSTENRETVQRIDKALDDLLAQVPR